MLNAKSNGVSVFLAGDGQCHAGLPQAVQREAKPYHHVSRAQRPDHHGETQPRHAIPNHTTTQGKGWSV